MIFNRLIKESDTALQVDFEIKPGVDSFNATLENLVTGEILNKTPNDVVISLIRIINSGDDIAYLKYVSDEPYWFFHDLAHSLFTPDLFIPKIIDIPRERELAMYKEGLVLARKYNLDEKYIINNEFLKTAGII